MFLKILGIIFIIIIVITAAVILYFFLGWKKLKKFANDIDMFAEIKVEVDPEPKWTSSTEIQKLFKDFAEVGFEPTFATKPLFGETMCQFFANKDRKILGSIAHYPSMNETYQEFSADTIDGINLNATNYHQTELFTPKAHKIIKGYPQASIAELHSHFITLCDNKELTPIPDETFISYLEAQLKSDHSASLIDGSEPLLEHEYENFCERWKPHLQGKDPRKTYTELVANTLESLSYELDTTLSNATFLSAADYNKHDGWIPCREDFDRLGYLQYLQHLQLFKKSTIQEIQKSINQYPDCSKILDYLIKENPKLKIAKVCEIETPLKSDIFGYQEDEENY